VKLAIAANFVETNCVESDFQCCVFFSCFCLCDKWKLHVIVFVLPNST